MVIEKFESFIFLFYRDDCFLVHFYIRNTHQNANCLRRALRLPKHISFWRLQNGVAKYV